MAWTIAMDGAGVTVDAGECLPASMNWLTENSRIVNSPSPKTPAIKTIQTIGQIETFFFGDAVATGEAGPLA